ncbi:MAG TPA: hypothetical protein VJ932_05505 [Alkalispirochaeta sp.]|nr:hypothetical protein [Alkalispirochaeta sp.]
MASMLTGTTVAEYLTDILYWTFLAMLLMNILQRKHQKKAERKRFATLYLALGVFALLIVSQFIVIYDGADWMLLPGFAAVIAVLYRYRTHTFPFRLRSPADGRKLTWDEILYDDNHGDDEFPEDQES